MITTAIFDVDHTITARSTGRRIAQCAVSGGHFPAVFLIRVPIFYLRYRLGNLSPEMLTEQLLPLEGRTEAELVEVARGCFENRICSDIYPSIEARIREYQRNGIQVILASSSFDFILQPLAEYLDIDVILATQLEYRDGLTTGRLAGYPCFGTRKAQRVQEFVAERDRSLGDAAFYTDSYHDVPLLDLVGHPYPVNPDRRLRRISRARAWPVVYARLREGQRNA